MCCSYAHTSMRVPPPHPPPTYDCPDVTRSTISRLAHNAQPQIIKIAIATAILLRVKIEASCTSDRSFMAASWKRKFGGGRARSNQGREQQFAPATAEDVTATVSARRCLTLARFAHTPE